MARWIKPSGEIVPNGRFIPLIEDRGLNGALLENMVAQAGRMLVEHLALRPDFYISFNVTPQQIVQESFVADLLAITGKAGLPPRQVCLEITERQLLASPDVVAVATGKLSQHGFRLAIDDAGTGHNGLAALQKLNVGIVKIDKYFIDHIDDDPRSRVMVDMFVSVAQRYAMQTVAEGVETESQHAVLRQTGVDAVQGYLFSKPMPAAKFLQALASDLQNPGAAGAPAAAPAAASAPRNAASDPNADEAARLEALYRLQILDTEEEEVFDRIPRMVQQALGVPMATIALIDHDRRWFKAVAGGKRGQIARADSFCNTTIQNAHPTVVTDTLQDPNFRENVLVTNAPHLRAYLGVPLVTNDGYRIGSLCCVDKAPRSFSDDEIQLVKDMSSIVLEQMEMRTLALFDPLTSARTRRGFCSEAKHQLEHARLSGQPFALIMLDIDHFKSVNDRFGHAIGDEVLTETGRRIADILPDEALFGRMGGEEFAVALPGTDLAGALSCAERIRSCIETPTIQTKAGALDVSISLGVAQADGTRKGLEELLEHPIGRFTAPRGPGETGLLNAAHRQRSAICPAADLRDSRHFPGKTTAVTAPILNSWLCRADANHALPRVCATDLRVFNGQIPHFETRALSWARRGLNFLPLTIWRCGGIFATTLVPYQGAVVEEGPVEALFTAPKQDYTRKLRDAAPIPEIAPR